MNVLRKRGVRWTLCVSTFFMVWLICILVAGRLVLSHESLLRGWLDGLKVFRALGLFEYSSDEDLDDAVIDSLALVCFPFSAWLAWRLNRSLKSRVEEHTRGNK